MKCFRHRDQDVVAICTHCTKGLCAECVVDADGGTACGEECARDIAFARTVIRRSDPNISLQREGPRFVAVLLLVMGVGYIIWGALEEAALLLFAGSVFVLAAAGAYWWWRHYPDVNQRD
jgi:hypothetical protein